MQKAPNDIVIFLLVVTGLILLLAGFIISIVYLYRRRQQDFEKSVEQVKLDNEKTLLNSQLEIQEQTFQHISREIHDNINLSLTLAKLNLHTLEWEEKEKAMTKVESSIELLTQSIAQLSDLSKSLDTGSFSQHGLLGAIGEELQRIDRTGTFHTDYQLTGNPVFMNSQVELVIFRIIQEAFNNIIKHAAAKKVELELHYHPDQLQVTIRDDGKGFETDFLPSGQHSGLKNMRARVEILGGQMDLVSNPGKGTTLNFIIPFEIT